MSEGLSWGVSKKLKPLSNSPNFSQFFCERSLSSFRSSQQSQFVKAASKCVANTGWFYSTRREIPWRERVITCPDPLPGGLVVYSVNGVYIWWRIFLSVKNLYFKTQPGPVAKNANLAPTAGNRIRDAVNLVQHTVNWATKGIAKSLAAILTLENFLQQISIPFPEIECKCQIFVEYSPNI